MAALVKVKILYMYCSKCSQASTQTSPFTGDRTSSAAPSELSCQQLNVLLPIKETTIMGRGRKPVDAAGTEEGRELVDRGRA